MRVSAGIENKAFYVNSTHDVRIVVGNFYKGGDAYLALPIGPEDENGNFTFMAAAHEPEGSSNYGSSFLLVASRFDDTEVTIYEPATSGSGWDIQETVTLSRLQTKLVASKQKDITGSLVTANKPISVVSGMDYSRVNSISGPDSMYISAPPLQYLAHTHIVPPIAGRDNTAGYFVRVVSAADNNTISIYNNSAGSWMTPVRKYGGQLTALNVAVTYSALSINCSGPCLVVMYNKGSGAPGTSDVFMMWVPSTELFTSKNSTIYTLRNLQDSNNAFNNYISIITYNPNGNEMFHNGSVIPGWEAVVPWTEYRYTGFPVEEGAQAVGSVSETRYLVWLYGHAYTRAYGYLATSGG